MERYKEKLVIQNIVMGICMLLLAGFVSLNVMSESGIVTFGPTVGGSSWQSQWNGFCTGASCALLLMMSYGVVRNLMALNHEKKLKRLYIKEHDERTAKVYTAARSAAAQTFLIFGLVATIVSAYFSVIVSLTILCCVIVLSILCVVAKFYYHSKF